MTKVVIVQLLKWGGQCTKIEMRFYYVLNNMNSKVANI